VSDAGPRILADVHEEKSGIPSILGSLGAVVEIASLPAGDYAVSADTLVERERVLDLHSAIVKGHFWAQIGRLRRGSAFPYLMVEGTHLDRGPLHPHAIRGACLAVIDLGIALIRSDHQRDSALWVYRLALRSQRTSPGADRPLYAQRPKPRVGEETSEAVLAAVPGVSTSTARALLARFGSLDAVLSAAPDEWREVPGVGRKRARALEETLRHRWPSAE
jgi:DNA excision repair protein ERCC-4